MRRARAPLRSSAVSSRAPDDRGTTPRARRQPCSGVSEPRRAGYPRSSAHRRTCSSDRKRSIVDQVAPMSSHHRAAGIAKWSTLSAGSRRAPSWTSSRIGSAQSGQECRSARPRAGTPGSPGRPRCSWRSSAGHPPRPRTASGPPRTVPPSRSTRSRAATRGRGHLRAGAARHRRARSRRSSSAASSCAPGGRPSSTNVPVDREPEVPIERVGRHGLTIRRRPSLDEGPEWPAVTPIASRPPTVALRPRSLAWKAHRQVRYGRNPAGSSRRLCARLGRCGSKRSPSRG